MRRVRLLPATMEWSRWPDGTIRARSPYPLGPYPARLTDRLEHWAALAPDRPFLAERDQQGRWQTLTYGDALRRARAVGQALVDRKLSADRPLAILSGHGLSHAVLALAALYAGVPYAPLAPAYALLSREFSALRHLLDRLRPGLIFAEGLPAFEPALISTVPDGIEVVTDARSAGSSSLANVTAFGDLESTAPTFTLEEAHARVGPETVCKILFTSGSTGHPKGVIHTQRMLCANQEQLRTSLAFLGDSPPILCDWLPWNHTFGGNHNFGLTLYNGGTMYLDAGLPVHGRFDATVANLREIATTAYFNVPRGFEMLLPHLQADRDLNRQFFSRLQILFYAGAGLRQPIADAFAELAVEACGERIPWVTGLGATESAPFALCTGGQTSMTARIGVPVPGVELKVAPVGEKLEARLRGPNITPGYWRDDALTRSAFDAEGFYCMGDAIDFADPSDPAQGFVFQGRLAEDFKLATGTWVWVGSLRAKLLAALGNLAIDVVVTGHDRPFVGLLIFPNVRTWSQLSAATCIEQIRERLTEFARAYPGSSTAVRRAIVLEEPPSLDGREITDKGTLNQAAVLSRRAAVVDALYAELAGPGVIET